MKTAKLGAMFLISIMALAGVGIGYAAWTDTITIAGTVNTGSVTWHFMPSGYSGTWVYKDLDDDSCEMHTSPVHGNIIGQGTMNHILVARSYAEQTVGQNDHYATVVFQNIFPCDNEPWCWNADLTIEYTGSVPGKINSIIMNNLWPQGDWEILLDQVTTLTITVIPHVGSSYVIDQDDLGGLQLHQYDQVHIVMEICIPEDNAYEGISGDFNVDIGIIQWNEYQAPP